MERDFTIVLRGYYQPQVDELVTRAEQALASGSATSRASARTALRDTAFTVVLRGYDRAEVDAATAQLLSRLDSLDDRGPAEEPPPGPDDFTVVLRGYAMRQVDAVLAEVDHALASGSVRARAHARDVLRRGWFERSWRGYSREQVDDAVARRLAALAAQDRADS